jgi:hypothetical protein
VKHGPWAIPAIALTLLAGAVAACGLWAFAPLPQVRIELPRLAEPALREAPEPVRLDVAAFHAPLWIAPVPPPPPPKPEPPPPPPPPLKLQLLAIVREADTLKAVLYDPDADRILVVAEGEPLGHRHHIERVRPDAVDIRDERGIRTLTLADSGGGR